ncbi:hypothetical protein Tco_0892629 [Tanacetum coccineum]|uniref:Uncharacterized protein n=1 Tax=Tanacetum coccineum TaxID=301880 RepID=A0ABQ5C9F1_9ASTR
MESSNSNSKERELQLTQRLIKQRHSHCMAWFEQLETHLRDLYLNSSSHAIDAFKPAFHSFFGEEHQTFRLKMFYNLDQLRLQLERENLLEVNPRTCLEALRTQFKEFFSSKGLQSQDVQINPVHAVDDSLSISKSSWIESEFNNALSKSVNETQLQQHESLVTECTTLEANLSMDVKALHADLVVMESKGTEYGKHDTSSSSGTYITHAVDADIRPVNDQVPFAEVDSNTTPDSTNMCHRGGEIDQDAEQYQAKSPLLKAEFLKTNDMVEKEVYNELSNRFLQLEKHCISLEISMQQKEESFQSNKPCKNQDAPEFCEFFEINDLKAQLQAKTTLICNDSNVEYLRANLNIKGMSNSRRTSLSNIDYMLYPSLLRTVTDWKGKPSLRSTERSLLHDNIVPKPDLALELGKSISLTEAEEEAVAREVHATHARIVSESEPEPTQRRQSGIAFRDSFIVSKKRSSDSSKKLKGIQTLTPAEQEAADIMKALKESKKMSKRQPGTGGSNEGTGNILGVPDESTVVSRASSEGTGSKPGVPDEEKLILEWEADVDSEHFDRDDNAGDDNEETKPDPEEIYK